MLKKLRSFLRAVKYKLIAIYVIVKYRKFLLIGFKDDHVKRKTNMECVTGNLTDAEVYSRANHFISEFEKMYSEKINQEVLVNEAFRIANNHE